jgi:hypothetical protein
MFYTAMESFMHFSFGELHSGTTELERSRK